MEDFSTADSVNEVEDLIEDEYADDEAQGVSFDDIVSFTMLLETSVTLIGITIFFLLIIAGVL